MTALPLTRAELIDAVERGETFRYLFFWGHTPRPDGRIDTPCLSQWWRCAFAIDGHPYSSAEQWMMAEKARLFGDDAVLRGFDGARWDAVRFERVVKGNVAKFGQDPALRAFLLSTAGQVLVEAAPRDRVWGIGLGRESPKAKDPRTWRGENLLGFALMKARAELGG